jgi:DNA/RNA-binding protein KIN17
MELSAQRRNEVQVQKQLELAKKRFGVALPEEDLNNKSLERSDSSGAIKFALAGSKRPRSKGASEDEQEQLVSEMEQDDFSDLEVCAADYSQDKSEGFDDAWLQQDIIVKIMNKHLQNGELYKQKGKVVQVIDHYVADVVIESLGITVRIDQEELETVIPSLGRKVMTLAGPHRRKIGILKAINEAEYTVDVELEDNHQLVTGLPYEIVSKSSQQ